MIPQIGKIVIALSLRSNSNLQKPHLCFTISAFFFSSSRTKGSKSKPATAVDEYLINQHQFSPEAALKASSAFAYLKNTEGSDSVLSFFRKNSFSQSHIEEMIKKVPTVLSADLDKSLKPKIEVFRDFGFSQSEIADIISSDPWILLRSVDNRLGPSIVVLTRVLGSNAAVYKVLMKTGWFLKQDLERTMLPNIEFLKSCGISSSAIFRFVFKFPRFFLLKPENLVDFVRRVDELGFDRKSKMLLPAIRVLSSMTEENWEIKLELFRSLGFSQNDILQVFRRVPQVFSVSKEKIKEVTELLLLGGNLDITYVVDHPELLTCSAERRVKPRLQIIDILENKNLIKKKPSLTTLCKLTERQFSQKYVLPYSNELKGNHFAGVCLQTIESASKLSI
ncbi:hypothetical protein UlMin_035239 [Ulmus minor]